MPRDAVVVIADRFQLPPAAFLANRLASLLKGRGIDVDVVLASGDHVGLHKAGELGFPLVLLDMSHVHRDIDLPVTDYFTPAVYLKLFVPRLLRERYRRLLYIDVDTYPESDKLFDLFGLDMHGHAVGAVRDLQIPFLPNPPNQGEIRRALPPEHARQLGAKYLNAGLLLIDTEAFARDRIEEVCLQVIREGKLRLRYPDQTLLNYVLRTEWLELSPAFNMVTRAWASPLARALPPVLVHFTGDRKPWHQTFVDEHPVRRELVAFLQSSPWPDFLARVAPPRRPGPPRPPERQVPLWRRHCLAALIQHVDGTPFADVEAGITVLDRAPLEAWWIDAARREMEFQ